MEISYDQPIYFIGIALPPELDRQISQLKWELYEQDKSLLKPLLPHVTLLHPPSLKGIMPEELLPRIHEITEKYLPLTLACQEVEFFGNNVSFIAIQSKDLISLQSQLVKLLPEEARALHYKRPYTPHITLAQAYEPHGLDIQRIKTDVSPRLRLPRQFTVYSVSSFKRILPREYRAEQI